MTENGSSSCRPARTAEEDTAPAPAKEDVPGRLRWLVSRHLDVAPEQLRPDVLLGDDLCVDSLAAIELTMVIEDEFDIALPEDEVTDVRTYGDILALVTARAS